VFLSCSADAEYPKTEHPLIIGSASALSAYAIRNVRFRVALGNGFGQSPAMNTSAQKSLSFRAWVELLLLALIWGASFLTFAIALREVGVFTVVAHRVFWAALLLWIYVLWRGIPIPRKASVWAACFVMGALNNAIPFTLIAWGQTTIESGLTAILNATTAFFGILLASLFLPDERLTGRKILGVGLGFIGVIVTIGWTALSTLDLRSLAQLAILTGALSYGFAAVWARVRLSDLSPETAALGMLTGSSLIMVPTAIVIDGWPTAALAPETLASLAYLSIFATFGAYLLYYRVLSMAGSGNLMLVTILISPTAVLLGALILGESLAPSAYAGFAILSLGLLIIDGRLFRRKPL